MFHIGPIWFDGTVAMMTIISCIIVFGGVHLYTKFANEAKREAELY